MGRPTIPNLNPYIQAGIDTRTGLPVKMGGTASVLKENMRKFFRIIDEQDALNRFTWYGLPHGLNQQLMERILYYKGQGAFFYMEADNTFYFLPYALDGSIDVYGRFTGITPLPFNGTTSKDGKDKAWIQGLTFKPQYDVVIDTLTPELLTGSCVLLHDYCNQISQTNIARQLLNEPLLDIMSDCVPFMRTALQNSTGVAGMRVTSQDESVNVEYASKAIEKAALEGRKWIPIIGGIDFQDLTSGEVAKSEEFLLALQSLDNLRLSSYGLDNGGLFQKKSHMLESEQEGNAGNVGLIANDGLSLRQEFCNIVNSIWNLGIWCEAAEVVTGIDKNGDGEVSDEQDGQQTPEQQGAVSAGGDNE